MCGDGVNMFDRDALRVFVKSVFRNGACRLSLGDYKRALNVTRA